MRDLGYEIRHTVRVFSLNIASLEPRLSAFATFKPQSGTYRGTHSYEAQNPLLAPAYVDLKES